MAGVRNLAAKVLLVLLLTACTVVGPDHAAPGIALPAEYSAPVPLFEDGPVAERWWLAFDDPVLARLVGRGVAENLAIRTVSGVREARAVARGGAA